MQKSTYTQTITITDKDTAIILGSGKLPVFATPAMIALMENTAMKCVESNLDANSDTVGVFISAEHTKASVVGQQITCTAKVINYEGRKIDFEITASDEIAEIGKATHTRFIINPEKFMSKLNTPSKH